MVFTNEGMRLVGVFDTPDQEPKAYVVLFHGFTGDQG
jgi:predicted alpha/beta-fold hydrolase